MKPLYMWAGGKNKMISKYKNGPGIPLSGYDTYVEPFFGGGAMMIYIYMNNPEVKRLVLNDVNKDIVGIYDAIKTDCKSFTDRVDTLSNAYLRLSKEDRKKFYYDLRKEYTTDWQKWNPVDESGTLYFLMKTGFNGIWRTTKESKGRFATACGLLNQTDSVYDKDNVMLWEKLLQKIEIMSYDWKDCVESVFGTSKTFYFLDPPYRDCFTTYAQTFDDKHQIECIDFCKKAESNGDIVMLCNRDSADTFFTSRQGNLSIEYYPVTYTAGLRKKEEDGSYSAKKATEILLYGGEF